jgi:hypothetical protein
MLTLWIPNDFSKTPGKHLLYPARLLPMFFAFGPKVDQTTLRGTSQRGIPAIGKHGAVD